VRAALTAALLFAAAATGDAARPPLVIGPGSGFRTLEPAMLRPLREDVAVVPILTVGDTLAPAGTGQAPYAFYPLPDGIGMRKTSSSTAEVYVAHEIPWRSESEGARVSRLALDLRNLGVLAGDYPVDGTEGFSRLGAASLVGPRDGFLVPTFLLNEESVDGPRRGVVAALDTRDLILAPLPWLGRFAHEATIVVPGSTTRLALILTEAWRPGESQLYLYLADGEADLLAGRGRLHVFRADPLPGRRNTRLASMAAKSRPISGRFVPVDPPRAAAGSDPAALLEDRVQRLGCLNFVRLEDAAPDRDRSNAFYFTDTGADAPFDPETGAPITGAGRVYHAVLDPFDPTRVERLSVVLDGDDGDDIYRPDNLDGDDRYLMIQEDPGAGRGTHPGRVLRYDTQTRRLEAVAECAERDPQGRPLPPGVGGAWESTGIVDVSDILGTDSWLLAVRAPNLKVPSLRIAGGGGQLLLLRGPRYRKRS
jgi:hypothetical protein